jgi:hypothetical protein
MIYPFCESFATGWSIYDRDDRECGKYVIREGGITTGYGGTDFLANGYTDGERAVIGSGSARIRHSSSRLLP